MAPPVASASFVEDKVYPYVCSLVPLRNTCTVADFIDHSIALNSWQQDAYYCAECTRLEKDRDGCPKVVNLGASRTDLAYLRKARNQQQQ